METYDNSLWLYDECEFSIKRIENMRFRKYLARICGEDAVFGLRRKFLRYHDVNVDRRNACYLYGDLPDGVYETSVRYYHPHENIPAAVDRKICIIFDGDSFNYPYGAFDRHTVLEYVDSIRNRTFDLCSIDDYL